MENQKLINLLDKIDTNSKHSATKKWYIINDENNTSYGVKVSYLIVSGLSAPVSLLVPTIQILLSTILEY